jgi:hypothetical protein
MVPRSAVAAAPACLLVALMGCSSAPQMTAVTHPVPAPTPTPTQLTGTALQSALLPVADFPPGYAVDTPYSSNSGSSLLSGTPSPTVSPQNCQQLGTAAAQPGAGLTADVRQVLYDTSIDHPSSYHGRLCIQAIFQFATPSGAAAYVNSLLSAISRCPTVAESGDPGIIKQTVSPAPQIVGHEAFLIRQTGTFNRAPTKDAISLAVDGTDVYTVEATVFGVPFTAPSSSFAALTAKLITRVQAMS